MIKHQKAPSAMRYGAFDVVIVKTKTTRMANHHLQVPD
jgi:hypothetical protein